MIRPLQPLELPEGARLDLIVITHEQDKNNGDAAKILAEIAALPLESSSEDFAGSEHVRKRSDKRDLFAELREGMDALADARQDKRTLRTHSIEFKSALSSHRKASHP